MQVDWAVVVATLLGPIFAVWASEWRQQRRALHERKEWVFRTLMTTRSTRLRQEHVAALNHIDFAFPQSKYPKIADAWGLYFKHLNADMGDTSDSRARWEEKANNLFAELIYQMAANLNISFSKTQVEAHAYYPSAYAIAESQQNELRNLALEVLRGDRSIPLRLPVEKS